MCFLSVSPNYISGLPNTFEEMSGFFSPNRFFIYSSITSFCFTTDDIDAALFFSSSSSQLFSFYRHAGLHLHFLGNGITNYFIIQLGNTIWGSAWQVLETDQRAAAASGSKTITLIEFWFIYVAQVHFYFKKHKFKHFVIPGCTYSHWGTRSRTLTEERDAAWWLFYSVFIIIKYKMGTYYINT